MSEQELLAEEFEAKRPHLRRVAYRMLGSLAEADDAVQEAWLRLSRSDPSHVDNLGGWLTTVVARVCMDMLRSRGARREEPIDAHVPDPIVTRDDRAAADHETLIADSVGVALLVVLETLSPAERVAFVLHDVFDVSFDDIASVVGRTPTAARQLASRARRRVRGAAPAADADRTSQRRMVDAFLAAARSGDLDGLLALLDPNVVLRADRGAAPGMAKIVRGARVVAEQAAMYSRFAQRTQPVLVNGSVGVLSWLASGQPMSVMGFTIVNGKIVAMDALADPERLAGFGLSAIPYVQNAAR